MYKIAEKQESIKNKHTKIRKQTCNEKTNGKTYYMHPDNRIYPENHHSMTVQRRKKTYFPNDIIQRCGDPDYVPDPIKDAWVLRRDQEDYENFRAQLSRTIETIPESLILKYSNKDCYGGSEGLTRVHIEMTGSRSNDRSAAWDILKYRVDRNKVELSREKYVWHHIPNHYIPWGILECDMVLIKERVHQKNHVGAVRQYENYMYQITKEKYGWADRKLSQYGT